MLHHESSLALDHCKLYLFQYVFIELIDGSLVLITLKVVRLSKLNCLLDLVLTALKDHKGLLDTLLL